MKSKKNWISLIGIFLLFCVIAALRLFSSEDIRICQNGTWIAHGKPGVSQPLTGCVSKSTGMNQEKIENIPFSFTSVFTDGGKIPSEYTCQGKNLIPPFVLTGISDKAVTLALVIEDPDAPKGTWYHAVIGNIPVYTEFTGSFLLEHSVLGKNSWGSKGYRGPCPPNGLHRYVFTMYVVDTLLNFGPGSTYQDLHRVIQGHVLDSFVLTGTYEK